MATNFSDYEMVPNTDIDENYFNPIWSDLDARLNALETGAMVFHGLISGALTSGRKAIIKLPKAAVAVKCSISCQTYTAGQSIIMQLYKNGEPSGGATGDALYSNGARPTLATSGAAHNAGASAYAEADQNIPLAEGDTIAVEVVQADSGPVSNLRYTIICEPDPNA